MPNYGEPEIRRSSGSGPGRPDVPDPRKRFVPLPDPDPEDDGPLPVDERLAMGGVGFRSQVRAQNTRDAYKRDFEHFREWCDRNTYCALPATDQTLEFYLVDNWRKMAIATLNRRLVGIAHAHKQAGHPSPTTSGLVRETLKGIRRAVAREGRNRQKQAAPLLMEDVVELIEHLDLSTLAGLRNRAILLVGFASAFRAEEHGSIQVSDLKKHRRGYMIHLRASKADQEGNDAPIAVPALDDKTICPVHALDEWIKASGIKEGAVFRYIDRHGNVGNRGLTRFGINYIIKRWVESAGWDASEYSGHSIRAGLPTDGTRNGVSKEDIKKQGRWKSDVVDVYIRNSSAFDNNAAAKTMMRPKG